MHVIVNVINILNYRFPPVTARSKAWVCGRSLAGIVVSIPAAVLDACLF